MTHQSQRENRGRVENPWCRRCHRTNPETSDPKQRGAIGGTDQPMPSLHLEFFFKERERKQPDADQMRYCHKAKEGAHSERNAKGLGRHVDEHGDKAQASCQKIACARPRLKLAQSQHRQYGQQTYAAEPREGIKKYHRRAFYECELPYSIAVNALLICHAREIDHVLRDNDETSIARPE